MDVNNLAGAADYTEAEMSASPIDPALVGSSKGKRKADDEEGEAEGNGKKRRNRKPVTCAQCRRRKLKCDRGFPCGACRDRQEGHLCEWEGAIRLPQAHLTRDAEAQELRLQLDRLEGLLGALSKNPIAAGAVAASGLVPSGRKEGEEESAAEALGLLAAFDRDADPDPAGSLSAAQQRAKLLESHPTVSNLIAMLPPKPELEKLCDRYISAEHLYFPTVHLPSFKAHMQGFIPAKSLEKPFFAAYLMAMISHVVARQATDAPMGSTAALEREKAAKRYHEGALEILRLSSYLEKPDLDVVRALLVLYHSATQTQDLRAASLLAQAIHCGQVLGLHRDPDSIPTFSLVDVEDRRRLWYLLLVHDKLDQTRRQSLIAPSSYDTREPTGAQDKDITETEVTAQPFPAFTPVLYLGVQTQLAALSQSINEILYSAKGASTLPLKYLQDQNTALDRIKGGLPALQWDKDIVIPLGPDNFASDRFRLLTHSIVLQLIVRLNRCFLTRGFADTRLLTFRNKVVEAAVQMVGLWHGYPDLHALASTPVLLQGALNGLVLLAIDLFQDPHGVGAEKKRRLVAAAVSRLRSQHRPRIVNEVLRVVAILDKQAPKQRSKVSNAVTAQLNSPLTSLARPLPLSLTADAFGPQRLAGIAKLQPIELSQVWRVLVESFPVIHAAPDAFEWTELLKVARGEQEFWDIGLDVLA